MKRTLYLITLAAALAVSLGCQRNTAPTVQESMADADRILQQAHEHQAKCEGLAIRMKDAGMSRKAMKTELEKVGCGAWRAEAAK